jgi:ABC-type polysaccharide/polyol phosphate export permease
MTQITKQTYKNKYYASFIDFRDGALNWRLWTALAWEDIRQRYMRSFIGILWVTISFAFFVAVKILIFTPLSTTDIKEFSVYVTIGFFAWTYISSMLVDGCVPFVNMQGWIKGVHMPLTTFICQSIFRNIIITLYNALVVIGVMLIVIFELTVYALLSIPTLLIFIINGLWIHFLMGVIATRYRDILHLVQTIMRVLFFMTPILWYPFQMGGLMKYLIFNPVLHYIRLLRDPILYSSIPMQSVYVVGSITIFGVFTSIYVFAKNRHKIVFWL